MGMPWGNCAGLAKCSPTRMKLPMLCLAQVAQRAITSTDAAAAATSAHSHGPHVAPCTARARPCRLTEETAACVRWLVIGVSSRSGRPTRSQKTLLCRYLRGCPKYAWRPYHSELANRIVNPPAHSTSRRARRACATRDLYYSARSPVNDSQAPPYWSLLSSESDSPAHTHLSEQGIWPGLVDG